MALTVYGIRNCDTVKRARKALEAAEVDYRFHDFRADGLSAQTVEGWIAALGVDQLLNRRGTTWRQLPDDQRARIEDEPAGLLAENPTLIKRPVFERDGELCVGFAARDEAERMAWLSGRG